MIYCLVRPDGSLMEETAATNWGRVLYVAGAGCEALSAKGCRERLREAMKHGYRIVRLKPEVK